MSFIIILIFNALLLLFSPKLLAAVVMIPTEDQSFESYLAACSKENSACTTDIIKTAIENAATPKYDQFILDLQLESQTFTNLLSARIIDIVETEMISMDQMESLINILQRSEELFVVKKNKLLKIELAQYLELVRHSPAVPDFNFVFLKKPIGSISFAKLKTLSFQPIYKKINFKSETADEQVLGFKSNRCSKSQLSDAGVEYFSNYSYVFIEEQNCSWTDSISGIFSNSKPSTQSESKYKLTNREKNIMLWSALAIGAGLFLSQYELHIEY